MSHFDDIAHEYDQSIPSHVVDHYLDKRERYLSQLVGGGAPLLEVGCGTGALARRLARMQHVVGVDPSRGMLEAGRAGERTSAEFVQAGGGSLPFRGETFALVFCVAVLHHVIDPAEVKRVLAEMVRVCRPGGTVVVWDHNPRNPYWPLLMKRVPQDHGDERLVTATEITAGLTAAGARILGSEQLGFVPDFTPRSALQLAERVERLVESMPLVRRLCAHNVVVATR